MALVPQGTTRTKWTRELTQDGEVSACARFELSCKAPDPRRLRIQQVGVVHFLPETKSF